ncbi:MAG TPA: MFS transporter, partial [Chloroflexota bacterium]|nr:MFS transporter [Chloroflexota bacterium]
APGVARRRLVAVASVEQRPVNRLALARVWARLSALIASAPIARRRRAPAGLWRHRDFLKLWVGDAVSVCGSQITPLALPLMAALALHATPGQMGLLRAAEYLPPLLVGPIAGVWVDRLRRRPILIWTDVARAAVLLAVPVAAALGLLHLELLYVVAATMAILGTVFGIAASAYLPSLVPGPSLMEANGKLTTTREVAYVAGPGLAGALVQLLSAPVAVAVDGLTFLASALGLAMIRLPEPAPPPRAQRRPLSTEIGEGFRTTLREPILRAFLASSAAYDVCWNAVAVVSFLYVTRVLGLPPAAYGFIIGVGSVGSLLGALVAHRLAQRLGLGPTIVGAQLMLGVGGLLLVLAVLLPARAFPFLIAAEVVQLFMTSVYGVNRTSLEQAITPAGLRGRVRGTRAVIGAGAVALGTLAGGLLGERVGVEQTIVGGMCGTLAAFLWLWWSPIRTLRDLPRLEEDGGGRRELLSGDGAAADGRAG